MELRTKTIRAIKWNFVATAAGAVVSLVQLWALSRILPPHEYGVIGAGFIVIAVFNIFIDFGLSNAIIRKQDITATELSSLYCLGVWLGLINFMLAFFLSGYLGAFFKSEEVVLQIRIMSLTFLFVAFGQQQRVMLTRAMRFDTIARVTVVTMLLNFVTVIGLALLYRKAWVASVAAVASTAVGCLMYFLQGLRERPLSFAFRWEAARPHLAYALFLVLDSLINVVSISTFPIVMGRLVNLTAIGGYNIANGISLNLIERLKPVLTQALFPAFARLQDDNDRLASNFLLVTTYGALINFPLLSGTLVCSHLIVESFFQPQWLFVAPLVQVLCLVGMVRSLDAPVISLLLVKARMHLNIQLGIPKLLLGVLLAYVLGIRYGLEGIVWSFLLVQSANTIAAYFFMVRACLPGVGAAYARSILIPALQALPIVLAAGALAWLPTSSLPGLLQAPAAHLALVVATGVLAYLLGLWFSPFTTVQRFVDLVASNLHTRLGAAVAARNLP